MRVLIAAVLLLAVAPAAQAKLTYKQAFAVLSVAAEDVTQAGEDVISGDCRKPSRNRADCGLRLSRPGNQGSLLSGPDTCSLSVTVKKKGSRYFYTLNYATGPHMAFAC